VVGKPKVGNTISDNSRISVIRKSWVIFKNNIISVAV